MVKRIVALVLSLMIVILGTACSVLPGASETVEVDRSFAVKDTIHINTVSSACIIRQADIDEVALSIRGNFSPKGSFDLIVLEEEGKLVLSESFTARSTSGTGEWIITVPYGVNVSFKSSSGSADVDGFTGTLHAETASGRVSLKSGRGEFDVKTSSGRVTASDMAILRKSSFSSSSGNVEVSLAEFLNVNLTVSSASGNAVLHLGGKPFTGMLEMSARVTLGKIESPFQLSSEDRFTIGNQEYARKTFALGSDELLIVVKTASGKAVAQK